MKIGKILILSIISVIIMALFGVTSKNNPVMYWVGSAILFIVLDKLSQYISFNVSYNQEIQIHDDIVDSIKVSKYNYEKLDVTQVDNHLYINGVEVRSIRFKDNTNKTIGQIINKI